MHRFSVPPHTTFTTYKAQSGGRDHEGLWGDFDGSRGLTAGAELSPKAFVTNEISKDSGVGQHKPLLSLLFQLSSFPFLPHPPLPPHSYITLPSPTSPQDYRLCWASVAQTEQ
jgi:hypothetical protein